MLHNAYLSTEHSEKAIFDPSKYMQSFMSLLPKIKLFKLHMPDVFKFKIDIIFKHEIGPSNGLLTSALFTIACCGILSDPGSIWISSILFILQIFAIG